MSLIDHPSSTTSTNKAQTHQSVTLDQVFRYTLCIGLGLVGGVTGVALAIGLAIVIQALLSPLETFLPGIISLAVTAVLFGLGVSWLLGQIMNRIIPDLSDDLDQQGMKIILIFSVLISLLESFLFRQGL